MSDKKKWFKVWASILTDPHFLNLSLQDKGRWCMLGAMLCEQGDMGKLKVVAPAKTLQIWFEVSTIQELVNTLKMLPNVHLTEGLDAYGSFIVTMINWRKYQVDSTIAERVTRLRRKRRGEEMLTSKSTSTSPPARSASRLDLAVQRSRAAGNGGNEKGDNVNLEDLEIAEANRVWKKETPVKQEIKSYEDAKDNELCGPPAGMWDRVKKGLK